MSLKFGTLGISETAIKKSNLKNVDVESSGKTPESFVCSCVSVRMEQFNFNMTFIIRRHTTLLILWYAVCYKGKHSFLAVSNNNKAEINCADHHNPKLVSKHEILKKESMIESTRDKSGDR